MSDFNENGYNIDNLKKLRNRLTEEKDDINLEMYNFVDIDSLHDMLENNEYKATCDTAACMVGHATRYFDMKKSEIDDVIFSKDTIVNHGFISFSERLFHMDSKSTQWAFLFDSAWCDDIEQAIARLSYVIKNNDCPHNWGYSDRF